MQQNTASKFCRASDFVQVAEWLTPLTKDSEVAGSNPTTVKANLHAQSWWITITSSHHHKETRMKSLSLLPRQMLLHKTRPILPLYITSVVAGRLLHWNEKNTKKKYAHAPLRTRKRRKDRIGRQKELAVILYMQQITASDFCLWSDFVQVAEWVSASDQSP